MVLPGGMLPTIRSILPSGAGVGKPRRPCPSLTARGARVIPSRPVRLGGPGRGRVVCRGLSQGHGRFTRAKWVASPSARGSGGVPSYANLGYSGRPPTAHRTPTTAHLLRRRLPVGNGPLRPVGRRLPTRYGRPPSSPRRTIGRRAYLRAPRSGARLRAATPSGPRRPADPFGPALPFSAPTAETSSMPRGQSLRPANPVGPPRPLRPRNPQAPPPAPLRAPALRPAKPSAISRRLSP